MCKAYRPDLWDTKGPCFLLFRCMPLLPGGMKGSGPRRNAESVQSPDRCERKGWLRVSAKRSHCGMAHVLDCAQQNAAGRNGGGSAESLNEFYSRINLPEINHYSICTHHSTCKIFKTASSGTSIKLPGWKQCLCVWQRNWGRILLTFIQNDHLSSSYDKVVRTSPQS